MKLEKKNKVKTVIKREKTKIITVKIIKTMKSISIILQLITKSYIWIIIIIHRSKKYLV